MRLVLATAILAASSASAIAQAPTAAQFQSYRQSMARELGNAYDAKAICDLGSATLVQTNSNLQKQVADLKAQLAKAKVPVVLHDVPQPEHNPPPSTNSGAK